MEQEKTYFDILGLKSHAPKISGMYFNEEYFCDLIKKFKEISIKDENGNLVCNDKSLEDEITANLLLIVKAIINKYTIWKFEDLDVLYAEGLMECWRYIPNFDPSKGTCFNLFSMICKYHLISYTKKDKLNRKSADVDIHPELESNVETNYDIIIQELEGLFLRIIRSEFKDTEKEMKYVELTAILIEYIDKNKQIIGKNDLMSAFRGYGYKSSEYKEFIQDILPYKEQFYDLFKKS